MKNDRLLTNKHAVLIALKKLKAKKATATYDGSGDSGCFNDVEVEGARKKDINLTKKNTVVILQAGARVVHGGGFIEEVKPRNMSLSEAIIDVASDWLEQEQGGWENNDGAEGNIQFDVETGKMRIEHTSRRTEYDQYDYEM